MLTRIKVSGFKNLRDTEIQLGPFTCVAGFNGVGKSNLFDAIQFLSHLADKPFMEAARATRGGSDVVDLFSAGGDGVMRFDCDLLIPRTGRDDFHQPAEASQTFLNYQLELRLEDDEHGLPRIRLEHERLVYVPRHIASRRLRFSTSRAWRDSVLATSHRRASFIDAEGDGAERVIRLSSDRMRDDAMSRRGGGRPTDFLARSLPRTVLSAAQNAEEARTTVLTRAEMRAWRNLQLEPSALRATDDLQSPARLNPDGRHLPATLYRLANGGEPERVYAATSNRVAELVDDVRQVRVERDDARRALRVVMEDLHGVVLPASSLSDGTLRFIALSVMEQDPTVTGLLCLEEPENGIHPERMEAMVRLLRDMAVDPRLPVDETNPLRQVVVSTHSPVVAARVDASDLVFADHRDAVGRGAMRDLVLRPIEGTWRAEGGAPPVSRGTVLGYLGSVRSDESSEKTVYEYAEAQLPLFVGSRR